MPAHTANKTQHTAVAPAPTTSARVAGRFWVCLPARLASSRLPRKPLLDIGGLPMVVRAALAAKATLASRVVVATDSEEIAQVVADHGIEVVMTRDDHPSGTDRLAEVAELLRADNDQAIINLQGDEPLMPASIIHALADRLLHSPGASVVTAVCPVGSNAELCAASAVKAVLAQDGRALYFSRAPVPYDRDAWADGQHPKLGETSHWRHLGLYGYRAGALRAYATWPESPLERSEKLEQLRWLEQGHTIQTIVLNQPPPPGVDTMEDLERVRREYTQMAEGRESL